MHYYPFNVKDYTYDTQHLTLAEHGALRLLIDRIHLIEKPLDSDETNLFRLMRIEKDEDKEIVRRMLKEFFIKKKNGWTHVQSEADIRKYKNRSDKGKRGAEARWDKESHASALPTNNQEPITKNQEPKNTVSIEDESFLKTFKTFWEKYPNKSNEAEAERQWLITKPPIDDVLKALSWHNSSDEWGRENGRYIPKPANYILNKKWKDARKLSEYEKMWMRGK
jgi:uncharacterized protein YdaU (DUF1376 family)